jgi:hypothetical protein
MGFWGDVGDAFSNIGQGIVGGGDGFWGDVGKGIGFLTPAGAITGVGTIAGTMGGMTGDSNAFGAGGGGGIPGGGIPGLAGMFGGAAGGGGGGGVKGPQQWQAGATPDSMKISAGPGASSAAQDQARGYQTQLLQQLQDQAAGKGPSLAQMQLQQGTEQNLRQQAAMAAGGRNPGLASYQAAQNQSGAGQQMAGQAAMARLQEQQQAQGMLGQLSGQMRGQDQGLMGMQNQFALGQAGIDQSQNALYNQLNAQQSGAYNKYQYDRDLQGMQNDADIKKAMIGGAFNAGASAAGMAAMGKSDERSKTDIQPGAPLLREMLDQIKAHDYEYKNPSEEGAAPGRHVSVMAQELEKSELGRRLVKDTPSGKMVDYGRGLGTMLAAIADMNSRVKELETRKKRKAA